MHWHNTGSSDHQKHQIHQNHQISQIHQINQFHQNYQIHQNHLIHLSDQMLQNTRTTGLKFYFALFPSFSFSLCSLLT